MGKLSARVKRPFWVAGLNIALALTIGSSQAFAGNITTVAGLLAVTGIEDYVLTRSLDLSTEDADESVLDTQSADVVTAGSSSYIPNGFTGTFDGGGFTIFGLTKPLFSAIGGMGADTTVFDLNLEAAPVDLEAATGGVIGAGILAEQVSMGTVIDNVDVRGNVFGEILVGGLVGVNEGTISNSSATGDVDGLGDVGGLVGYNDGGTITNSYATGAVIGNDYVGGLVGRSSGTITDSSATGAVIGNDYVGGLVGSSSGPITDSSATGTVIGNDYVGGLVGRFFETRDIARAFQDVGSFYEALDDLDPILYYLIGSDIYRYENEYTGWLDVGNIATISNSYATGAVTGDYDLGGLVGQNEDGNISNSYATGAVTGDEDNIGGLVGINEDGNISNSYATGAVTGGGGGGDDEGLDDVGGLVGENEDGNISNSYATGAVTGVNEDDAVGGLVGYNTGVVSNSYATGAVNGDSAGKIDRLVGADGGNIDDLSYATGAVNDEESDVPPLSPNELLVILNTGSFSPIFALNANINSGLPYLISNPPPSEDNGDEQVSPRFNFSFLSTQVLDSLKKSVGFTAAKSDLSKLDLALLDQVKSDKSAQIIGGKLFSYQSPLTSLSVGSLLQLEINFEANKSLQMWVKSLDDQYVLVGDITFDKDGNAVLPGIEFKKSGQYELIFVNSDKKDLTQPELMNKVIGLTVYVN
jgi:hypothetical protein